MAQDHKIRLLPHTCSFSNLSSTTEAKTQARLCWISPPSSPSPSPPTSNSSNNSYPTLSSPTYKHERTDRNFTKMSCRLYALCKIHVDPLCLFLAHSSTAWASTKATNRTGCQLGAPTVCPLVLLQERAPAQDLQLWC